MRRGDSARIPVHEPADVLGQRHVDAARARARAGDSAGEQPIRDVAAAEYGMRWIDTLREIAEA